ncbi:hypothetical protein K2173_007275 [Erythroxylum novogranatense]|uniref:ARID domain-containing protein n=1 Tax=Erythroxylum novogranatense TaxID=1862640 RepID=A0AAV8T794_9ROSI|nr:hypothetical protein K2173_007275 [Erythroxylum novogranatense]
MTDTEMPAQDLEDDPGVKPVEDGVQAQQNQQSDAHHQVTAGDNTLTLPSDVPMTDVQPSSHDLPDVLVSSQDKISPASNGNDVRRDKVPEQKFDGPPEDKPVLESNLGEKLPERRFGDGDVEIFERQPETATPLPLKKYPTHKSKHDISSKSKSVWTDVERGESDESGTPEERASFMKELETFYRENALEFKPPKFYGEPLNCLKLWRAVIKLGGYEVVTASKLWRQVGESFHPPKTCTTVSWTFRIFYEKALLEYEKHKRQNGELQLPGSPVHQSTNVEKETSGYQPPGSGSGRERRIAATRAMQGWHAQRLLGYGEISEPIIKDKNLNTATKREKTLKSIGLHKQKTNNMDPADKHGSNEADRELRLLLFPLPLN